MHEKKHANKHQVKEDQTHMLLPPEGTSHAVLLADITFGHRAMHVLKYLVKSVQSALSDLKRRPERLQSQCNYRPFIT